jgi:hypothetical protein
MKPHVALTALMATLIAVTVSHLEWVQADGGHLLMVDGRPLDAEGLLRNQMNSLLRNCTDVQVLQADDKRLPLALQALKKFSPPASQSARVAAASARSDWMLLEVEFDDLQPAAVLMQKDGADWVVAQRGIWSGQTHPWLAATHIRAYLARQVESAPADLLACFDPKGGRAPSPQSLAP